jgi:hypothetical protein
MEKSHLPSFMRRPSYHKIAGACGANREEEKKSASRTPDAKLRIKLKFPDARLSFRPLTHIFTSSSYIFKFHFHTLIKENHIARALHP